MIKSRTPTGLHKCKGIVMDLDGVVYRGSALLEGAVEFLHEVRRSGRKLLFLTNASMRSREDVAVKLRGMGIECKVSEVITSAYAAAEYVRGRWGRCSVFVVGDRGIYEELELVGVSDIGMNGDARRAKAVVAGLDKKISYGKLHKALDCMRAGAVLIACNEDATYPIEGGRMAPGAGATVGALEKMYGKRATVVGKPTKFMMRLCFSHLGLKPSEVAVVGDRLETDMLMANRAGALGVLVLTGVSERRHARSARGMMKPKLVVKDLRELARSLG